MGDFDRRGRAHRRSRSNGLVRPYVLGASGSQGRRRAPSDGQHPRPPESHPYPEPYSHPYADATSPDLLGAPWADAPPPPDRPAGTPRPGYRPPSRGSRRRMPPPLWQDSLLVLARHRSLTAICALALLVAITGTMFLVSSQNSPRLLANSCSASRCHRLAIRVDPSKSGPARTTGPSTSGRSHRSHAHGRKHSASPSPTPTTGHRPTPHPTRSPHSPKPKKSPTSPHPTTSPTAKPTGTPTGKPTSTPTPPASPTSTPTPTPTGTPDPAVSYSVVHRWWGGFQGEFTIVNKGTAPINGWELRAALPFDHIDSVWDAVFHTDGDTLVLDPPSYQVTIPPGGTLTEDFTAKGGWTHPSSCTFNGSPC